MTPSRSRLLLLIVTVVCLAATPAAQARPRCAGADATPTAHNLRQVSSATLCLLNAQRAAQGLRPLRANRRLAVAAARHSRDMTVRHYFEHTAPGGLSFVTRVVRTGYAAGASTWTMGENIAWGGGPFATPREIVRMWMHSPGHRDNILRRSFREIGVGIATRGPYGPGATYTTDFGARG